MRQVFAFKRGETQRNLPQIYRKSL